MSEPTEIYCYSDPNYKGNTDAIISLLRDKGHRVLVGKDLDELNLLLQLSNPTAVIYTLASEGAALSSPFLITARRALVSSVPMIVMGPNDTRDGFTLYYPERSRFVKRHIPFHMLTGAIEDLRDDPPKDRSFESMPDTHHLPEEVLSDVIDDDSNSVKIETKIKSDKETWITTAVSRDGDVIIREEQVVDPDDPELAEKIEIQHLTAISSYTSASSFLPEDTESKYRGEVSAPIVLPKKKIESHSAKDEAPVKLKLAVSLLLSGSVCCLIVAFYFSTSSRITMPTPKKHMKVVRTEYAVTPVSDDVTTTPKPNLDDLILDDTDLDNGKTKPASIAYKPLNYKVAESRNAFPFPGRFRPGKSVFFFPDEWEEQRFANMIKALPNEKKIRVIGRPTDEEVKQGKQMLGKSRAWSVLHYLKRLGIAGSRITPVRGKPVPTKSDLDSDGRPRNRWVEVVIE
ncbi:MAG: hypothetical protein GY847_00635 [Proteobacteria bacterium]|nr:hypothetical protein [Pseudomonadota bacterium]